MRKIKKFGMGGMPSGGLGNVGTPPAGGPKFGSMGAPNMSQPGNPGFPSPLGGMGGMIARQQGSLNPINDFIKPGRQQRAIPAMGQNPGATFISQGPAPVPVGGPSMGSPTPGQIPTYNPGGPSMGGAMLGGGKPMGNPAALGTAGLGAAVNNGGLNAPVGGIGGLAGMLAGKPMGGMPQSNPSTMKKGGKVKSKPTSSYKSGGSVSSASKRADGCAIRGKTRA